MVTACQKLLLRLKTQSLRFWLLEVTSLNTSYMNGSVTLILFLNDILILTNSIIFYFTLVDFILIN